ncbi:MAG: 2-C-methyl-D-erythritol 2,4-cyclodiphosphate synthase [Planctomycetota bacterium]|jgi:2-C-methyl-D-erythritol 2,4-cyclodiphosphate synthase
MRIGIGIDGHCLVKGRKLVLGGVEIPFEKGLLGHSDGDAVLHAAVDAILGAAGLGDIGQHFPDTDAKFKNIPSTELAGKAVVMVREAGWDIVNIDLTIIAEAPKLGPHKADMAAKMREIFGCPVSVKAKTTEGLSVRDDAIAAHAVALLKKRETG